MSLNEYRPQSPVSHAMAITLSYWGQEFDLYQPAEGGWRVKQDGPGRHDIHGLVITHDTIDACLHIQRPM